MTTQFLQEYHDKQMARLAKEQARSALKRERYTARMEEAYVKLRQGLAEGPPVHSSRSVWATLRMFIL